MSQASIDLHIHTTASDGSTPPAKLLDEAISAGLKTISLTDHESLDGMDSISSLAEAQGLKVIPGIEFLTFFQGREIHLLGYCFDTHDRDFRARIKEIQRQRNDTSLQIVDNLDRLGFKLDKEQFYQIAAEGRTIGKNHIIMALFKAGYLKTKEQAIDTLRRYLSQNGLAYVIFTGNPFAEAVELIRKANGVPVLAHPGLIHDDKMVVDLLNTARIGLEVYYHYFGTNRRQLVIHYERMASEKGLVTTGGSDYHGAYTPDIKLGSTMVPSETLDSLLREKNG
ncbi:MAG: PHP domain-containing protein [Syntrophomonadaceae bacterium]|nr:PHP domain-containing protein [Syntrophomonadaceae bacterium]